MTALCFVDANVLVYSNDPRDASKQERAREWLDLLWRERRGRTSVQAMYETYVTLSRLGAEDAWNRAARYFSWQPAAIDSNLLMRARELEQRFQLSWWDGMIVAAAQALECRILLTEDLQDGQMFGTVRVRNPFLHAVEQPSAEYTVKPLAVRRGRGRPRRAESRA